jgi:DNA helicase-2/ATP-dependent DNA helicase PcrA
VTIPAVLPTPVGLGELTFEQLLAAGSDARGLYIVAAPGSGKTRVAAYRFGALRFAPGPHMRGDRACGVVATSFTKAATRELRRRVAGRWGPTALTWPHRVVTIDTIVAELLHHLLAIGVVAWPDGHTRLQVHDTWKLLGVVAPTHAVSSLVLDPAGHVTCVQVPGPRRQRVRPEAFVSYIRQGHCTHDDVRAVMTEAVSRPPLAALVADQLARTMRALIVDEVFDANPLDLRLVELAAQVGVDITIVGDPWQAVYDFRGACADLVDPFANTLGLTRLPLNHSHRWETHEQQHLADTLRAGLPANLPSATPGMPLDMILATTWRPLWDLGPTVLPLAFASTTATSQEAAATILLNRLTQAAFNRKATFFDDALTTLGIRNPEQVTTRDHDLDAAMGLLDSPHPGAVQQAWRALVSVIGPIATRPLAPMTAPYDLLGRLQARRHQRHGLRPAVSVHQAKGGEWPVVGVHLERPDLRRLASGLRVTVESDRLLYVACTRAKRMTYRV